MATIVADPQSFLSPARQCPENRSCPVTIEAEGEPVSVRLCVWGDPARTCWPAETHSLTGHSFQSCIELCGNLSGLPLRETEVHALLELLDT